MYLLFLAPFLLLGLWAQSHVGSTFRKWSQVPSSTGMTGAEVARRILDQHGLHDVTIHAVPGELSDHYDPRARTVNLSEPVYGQRTVAAASVAAHEVGHALQHAHGYVPLQLRSAFFPVAAFGSSAFMPLFIIGIVLYAMGSVLGVWAFLAAIVLYGFAVLFQLVTLPVEFNASSRARGELETMMPGAISQDGQGTAAVLNAAALTYVAAALAALAQLMWLVVQFASQR